MYSQSENSSNKPKIRFVKHLKLYCGAICLYWIDEIHIDESFRNSKILNDLIKHELKHYYIFKKIINTRKLWKKLILALYNDLWDFYDSLRIELKELILKCKNKE